MDFPQNEDSTTVDTYQEDAEHIKMVFENVLKNNPPYKSVKKNLYKELGVRKTGGRIGEIEMIDRMRISNRNYQTINLLEVGHNFHLMVNGTWENTRTIHMKTKWSLHSVTLQGLSAAKIAQTLMY